MSAGSRAGPGRHRTWWFAAVAAGVTVVTLATPAVHNGPGGWTLVTAFVLSAAGCWMAWHLIEDTDPRAGLAIVLLAAVAMRAGFLLVDPQLSTDVYRYIWDGRVSAQGINPYRFVPAARDLEYLRDPLIWPLINRADYAVTIYPPVAQAFFWLVTRFGESVVVMKLGLMACEAVTVFCLLSILDRQHLSRLRVLAYAWHPLPIWEIGGNAHVDAAMIALLMAAVLLYCRGQVLLAGVAATLGALVKPMALLALPVFWRPWNWRLPAVVFACIGLAYVPFLSVGWRVLGFIPGYVEEEGLKSGRGFRLLASLQDLVGPIPNGATVYLALAALILAGLALASGFRLDRSEPVAIKSLGWLLVAFLILTSPHYPWYFLALVPFLVLAPTCSAWTLSIAPIILYAGTGFDYGVRNDILSLVTFAALAVDAWRYASARVPSKLGVAA